jgi:hypothetical protein
MVSLLDFKYLLTNVKNDVWWPLLNTQRQNGPTILSATIPSRPSLPDAVKARAPPKRNSEIRGTPIPAPASLYLQELPWLCGHPQLSWESSRPKQAAQTQRSFQPVVGLLNTLGSQLCDIVRRTRRVVRPEQYSSGRSRR